MAVVVLPLLLSFSAPQQSESAISLVTLSTKSNKKCYCLAEAHHRRLTVTKPFLLSIHCNLALIYRTIINKCNPPFTLYWLRRLLIPINNKKYPCTCIRSSSMTAVWQRHHFLCSCGRKASHPSLCLN